MAEDSINIGAFLDRKLEELKAHEDAAMGIRLELKDLRKRIAGLGRRAAAKTPKPRARKRGLPADAPADAVGAV